MRMKIFVTGSTGFIGKNLIPRLLASDFSVVSLVRPGSSSEAVLGTHLLYSKLNEVTSNHFFDIDCLIHLASSSVNQDEQNDLMDVFTTNVVDSYSLFLAALNAGVKKIIYVSSCFEYGYSALNSPGKLSVRTALMPQTQYAATKAAFSTLLYPLCNYYNSDIYNLRAFNLYGPHERDNRLYPAIQQSIKSNSELHITHGSQIKYFSHVSSIVEKIIDLVDEPLRGSYFKLEHHGCGEEKSVYTFARSFFDKAGKNVSLIKRTKPSRVNEPQVLTPDLSSCVSIYGEPL